MTPGLSGHFSIFSLVFFVLKSLLGIGRQWSHEKFAILTLKPRLSHVRILIYLMWLLFRKARVKEVVGRGEKGRAFSLSPTPVSIPCSHTLH